MNETDRKLAERVQRAMPTADVPAFEATLLAASRKAGRRRHGMHLLAAAAVAAIAVAVLLDQRGPGEHTLEYIEMAELMDSTTWSAPSDSLLPDRRFDIYQDLPTLMESTEVSGGALL